MEFGITVSEGAMMDLLGQLPSWATEQVISNKVYYFLSRNKVIAEIPFFYKKADTVYRSFRALETKKLIEYLKVKNRDYIRLTALGKTWNKSVKKLGSISEFGVNSEIDPSKLGNRSEFYDAASGYTNVEKMPKNSDSNPTNNIYKEIRDNSIIEILKKIQSENPIIFDMILQDSGFHERLLMRLNSLKLNADFKKDIIPILIKWLCDTWTGGGLNSTGGKIQTKCTSYVIAVIGNGGLNISKKQTRDENQKKEHELITNPNLNEAI